MEVSAFILCLIKEEKGQSFQNCHNCILIMRCDIFRCVRISSLFLSVNRMYNHADTILVFEFSFFYTLPTTLLSCGNFQHFCTLSSTFVENPWLGLCVLNIFVFAFKFCHLVLSPCVSDLS